MELEKGEHCGEFHGRTIQVEVAGHTTNRTSSSDMGLSNENTVFTSIKISKNVTNSSRGTNVCLYFFNLSVELEFGTA